LDFLVVSTSEVTVLLLLGASGHAARHRTVLGWPS
jgi:hypothetical protein